MMNFHLPSNNLRSLKEYKPMLVSAIKILALFVAALYLLGFTLFPLLGVGNYQLVRIDALLPSEWVMLICLSAVLFAWSFRCLVKLSKESRSKNLDTATVKYNSCSGGLSSVYEGKVPADKKQEDSTR
jgi:hypothetical protein